MITFLVVGAAAGFLAGYFMKGEGFGILGNLGIGIVGSLIGRFLFGVLGLSSTGLIGSLITATVGAVALLYGIDRYKNG
ncbi:MAG: GlsB/YeaQ/YmgE family stress response membrane protein [Calditrichota bacterium]